MIKYYSLLIIFILVNVSCFCGCAAQKDITKARKITAEELIDSLIATDTLIENVHMTGKGKFTVENEQSTFMLALLADRSGKMQARVSGPLGITIAAIWICGRDSMCIFIPSKNTVLVEPLGADIPDIVLPPAAPVMLDMFCGIAPIYRFADSLTNFEKGGRGYYLSFQHGNQVLVALAEPNPWHISEFQWAKTTNPREQVDVEFSDGKMRDGIWCPGKIEVTAPALGQKIEVIIKKYERNIEIPDSLFTPLLPPQVTWQSAF